MTNIDLVQLELLLGESREAASGEWRADYTGQDVIPGALLLSETEDRSQPIWIAAHNTALRMTHAKAIAALRNAAPELLRLARIGQEAADAEDPGFKRDGNCAVCRYCGRVREGTVGWFLEHRRECSEQLKARITELEAVLRECVGEDGNPSLFNLGVQAETWDHGSGDEAIAAKVDAEERALAILDRARAALAKGESK